MLGMYLQKHVDILMSDQLAQAQWGVITATNSEFLIPDYIGIGTQFVPVSPTLCLSADHSNAMLSASNVAKVNSSLAADASEYLIAHDFMNCPLV
jgi:hypothetical protein